MGIKVDKTIIANCTKNFDCLVGKHPSKYLGLPLWHRKPTKDPWGSSGGENWETLFLDGGLSFFGSYGDIDQSFSSIHQYLFHVSPPNANEHGEKDQEDPKRFSLEWSGRRKCFHLVSWYEVWNLKAWLVMELNRFVL